QSCSRLCPRVLRARRSPPLCNQLLFRAGEPQREPRFLPGRSRAMNRSRFSGFVERRTDIAQRLGCVVFLARAEQLQITTLEAMEPRLDTAVLEAFAGAV